MKENKFVQEFFESANEGISTNIVVKKGANLFYQLCLNKDLKLVIEDIKNPKRGSSAFQTDICFFEKVNEIELPRVVIEFKVNLNTHDILTYSYKAGKHKQIYPFLRYGLLAIKKSVPARFFIHNEHIDFFIAAQNYQDKIQDIMKLVSEELEISRKLEKMYFDKKHNCNHFRKDYVLEIRT